MKIAIVGAGISGLYTYLYLRKHLPKDTTITVYKSHQPRADPTSLLQDGDDPDAITFEQLSDSTHLVGGALGIAPNGMRSLRHLNQAIYDEIVRQGFVVRASVFRAARGWQLAKVRWGDRRDPEEWLVAVARHRLWAVLQSHVGEGVVRYRKVKGFEAKDGAGVVLTFEEGVADEEFDLVIGADGVKSNIRKTLFNDKYPAIYEYVESSCILDLSLRPTLLTDSAEACSVSEASLTARSQLPFRKTGRWCSLSVPMASSATAPAPTKRQCGGRLTRHQFQKS